MSDVGGVCDALVRRCRNILYPVTGVHSVSGRTTFVRRGHLLAGDMQGGESIRNGNDYVTVCVLEGHYTAGLEPIGEQWIDGPVETPSISVCISDLMAEIVLQDGVPARGVVGLEVRWPAAPHTDFYAYASQVSDGASDIALALAAQIAGASVMGSAVVIPHALALTGRVGGLAQSMRRVRRQRQRFRVSFWSSALDVRDQVGAILDLGLMTDVWLDLGGGESGLVTFAGVSDGDAMQMQSVYRRDILLDIEFDTFEVTTHRQMIAYGADVVLPGANSLFSGAIFG